MSFARGMWPSPSWPARVGLQVIPTPARRKPKRGRSDDYSAPTRTSALPKLPPRIKAQNASGALARPSLTSSR